MKKFKTKFLLVAFFVGVTIPLLAQEVQSKSYWVHEDVVKPAMVGEYESICKELTSNLKKHNIQDMTVIVSKTADNRYLWVSPVENMAQLDKPVFATLAEKMGADKMGSMFDKMNKSYDVEHDYILHLDEELSYMPNGMTQTPEGQDYRKFHYYHYTPANADVVKEKAAAIKKLFANKGSQMHYRMYKSGFGTRGAFFLVAISAKDALDYATVLAENNTLLGEEWQKLYGEFMEKMLNYEAVEGQMRTDMAYAPSN